MEVEPEMDENRTGLEPPRVSVIVPVHNDREGLRRLLPALTDQTYPAERYEVLVVDNSPERGIEDLVDKFPQARALEEATPGSYAARNRGIVGSKGDILAFTDADCVPERRWLEAGVRALTREPNVGIVGGRIRVFPEDESDPRPVELYEMVVAFDQRRYVQQDRFAATANLFTDRRVIDTVGPFDDTLRSGGDSEWCHRAHEEGVGIAYAPSAVVRHPARRTLGELSAKLRRLTEGSHRKKERGLDGVGRPFHRRLGGWLANEARKIREIAQAPEIGGPADRLEAIGVSLMSRAVVARRFLELRLGSVD